MKQRVITAGIVAVVITGVVGMLHIRQYTSSRLSAVAWYGTGQIGSPCETNCDCAFMTDCFTSIWPMRQYGYCDSQTNTCVNHGSYDFNCYTTCGGDADCGVGGHCFLDGHCTAIQLPTNCPTGSASSGAPSSAPASSAVSSIPLLPSSASSVASLVASSVAPPSSLSVASSSALSVASSVSSVLPSSASSSRSTSSLSSSAGVFVVASSSVFSSIPSSPSSSRSSSRKSCAAIQDCNDRNICTVDQCAAGTCRNDSISCDDGDACTTDSCDPATGCNARYTGRDCKDDDICTKDSCDSAKGCVHTPVKIPCQGENECTVEQCTAANTCPDGKEQSDCCKTNDDCDYLDDGFSNCAWGACVGGKCEFFNICDIVVSPSCCAAGQKELFNDALEGSTKGIRIGGAFVVVQGKKAFMPVPKAGNPGTIRYDTLPLPTEGSLCMDVAPFVNGAEDESGIDTLWSIGTDGAPLAFQSEVVSRSMDRLSLKGTTVLTVPWMYPGNQWQHVKVAWNEQKRTILINDKLLAEDKNPMSPVSSPLYLGSFLGEKDFARFALHNLTLCGPVAASSEPVSSSPLEEHSGSSEDVEYSSAASVLFDEHSSAYASVADTVSSAMEEYSSAGQVSSPVDESLCTGFECEEWGNASCEVLGRLCIQIPEYPCVQCSNDLTSARSYENIRSSRHSSIHSSPAPVVGGMCFGNECDFGGDVFCSYEGKSCISIPDLPCVRCEGEPAAQPFASAFSSKVAVAVKPSPFIQRFSSMPFVIEHTGPLCQSDGDCPAGRRCVGGECLTKDAINLLPPYCGNARIDPGETCDEGSANSDRPNALCRRDCIPGRCGDGIIDTPLELCDDGNILPGDGCSPGCQMERSAPHNGEALPASIIELPFAAPVDVSHAGASYVLAPSLPIVIQQLPQPPLTSDTGPAAIIIMVSGAAAGYAFMRRKK